MLLQCNRKPLETAAIASMVVAVRAATYDDVEEICRLQKAAVLTLDGGFYKREVLDAWVAAMTPEHVRQGLHMPSVIGFVAVSGGRVVGFAVLHGSWVQAVYVDPACQKKGVGSCLLSHLEGEAALLGIDTLLLRASLNALPFYESRGYRVAEHYRLPPFSSNLSVACVRMHKGLKLAGGAA